MNGDSSSTTRAKINPGYWTHVVWYLAVVGLMFLFGLCIARESDRSAEAGSQEGSATSLADATSLPVALPATTQTADDAVSLEQPEQISSESSPALHTARRIRNPFVPSDSSAASSTSREFLIGLRDSFVRTDVDPRVEPNRASAEPSSPSSLWVSGGVDSMTDEAKPAPGHDLRGNAEPLAGNEMDGLRSTHQDQGSTPIRDKKQATSQFRSLPASDESVGPSQTGKQTDPVIDQPESRIARRMTEPTDPSVPTTLAPGLPKVADPQIGGREQSVYQLASQPPQGATFDHHRPNMDQLAIGVPVNPLDFSEGPCYDSTYDPIQQMQVYEGKQLNATRRPLVELGRPWYQLGPISDPLTIFGRHNPLSQQFIIFGDSRIGVASNQGVNEYSSLIARQTNLFFDYKVTSTERFNMFVSPSTRGTNSTRYEFDNHDYISEFNFNIINGFFEGDLGPIWGGLSNQTLPFDLPVAIGVMPLLFQNGVWMEDNILGFAATIPARNIPAWNVSNMDVTFFAGYDNVNSPAFDNVKDVARIYGLAGFVEAWNGYLELDYAFLDDRQDVGDRSYHNIGIGYSRRWGRFVSNSTRVIVNAGQDTGAAPGTADGVLLLSENSLITSSPSNIVPYLNLFAGFDRPQSAARAAQAGGVLRNTGILFETDNLTNYPTLDATANNTFGAALGVNLLSNNFNQQLVLETAMLGVMDEAANRQATAAQYGFGARYQLPLTHSVLLRADAMYGFLVDSSDIHGVRLEIRRKF